MSEPAKDDERVGWRRFIVVGLFVGVGVIACFGVFRTQRPNVAKPNQQLTLLSTQRPSNVDSAKSAVPNVTSFHSAPMRPLAVEKIPKNDGSSLRRLNPNPRTATFSGGTVTAKLHRSIIPQGNPVAAVVTLADKNGKPWGNGTEITATVTSTSIDPDGPSIVVDVVENPEKPGEFELRVNPRYLSKVDQGALMVSVRDPNQSGPDSTAVVRLAFENGSVARLGLPMATVSNAGIQASVLVTARQSVDLVLRVDLLDSASKHRSEAAAESSIQSGQTLLSVDVAWNGSALPPSEARLQYTLYQVKDNRTEAIDVLERPVTLERAIENMTNPAAALGE